MAFGGAGPTHVFLLAREVGIRHVIVPALPGGCCALGCLVADLRADFVRTWGREANEAGGVDFQATLEELERRARSWIESERVPVDAVRYEASAEMRYKGQSFEISVPIKGVYTLPEVLARFHERYRAIYGYADDHAAGRGRRPSSPDRRGDAETAFAGRRARSRIRASRHARGVLRRTAHRRRRLRPDAIETRRRASRAPRSSSSTTRRRSCRPALGCTWTTMAISSERRSRMTFKSDGVLDRGAPQSLPGDRGGNGIDRAAGRAYRVRQGNRRLRSRPGQPRRRGLRGVEAHWGGRPDRHAGRRRHQAVSGDERRTRRRLHRERSARDAGECRRTCPTCSCGSPSFTRVERSATRSRSCTAPISAAACPARSCLSNHEIYQEGLRIPPSRLLRRGEVNEEFLNLFMLNVRIPDQNWGDLKALIAGLNTAEQRVHDLIGRYDANALENGISRVLDYAEAEARDIIARVPDGTYTFWDYTEGDHAGGGMVRVKLHLRVEGTDLHFDFTRPIRNCDLRSTCRRTRYAGTGWWRSGSSTGCGR